MKDTIKLTLKLTIICIVAAILLAGTYVLTKGPIEEQQLKAATEARQKVLDADSFEPYDIGEVNEPEFSGIDEVFIGKDSSGNVTGATILMRAKGYKPNLVLTVGIQSDGTVSGINIGSNDETPGLGAKASDESFYGQFAGSPADGSLIVVKKEPSADNEIKAIAGATLTSKGVTEAVNTAVDFYLTYLA